MECKLTNSETIKEMCLELIDTLWNVNTTIMNEFIKKVSKN